MPGPVSEPAGSPVTNCPGARDSRKKPQQVAGAQAPLRGLGAGTGTRGVGGHRKSCQSIKSSQQERGWGDANVQGHLAHRDSTCVQAGRAGLGTSQFTPHPSALSGVQRWGQMSP